MSTMTIDSSKITKHEMEYFKSMGNSPSESIKNMIALLKEKSKDAISATVTNYISDRLSRIADCHSRIGFKEAYEDYLEYCSRTGSQVVIKKEFSGIMESCGIPRQVIGGNRNVFMFVEFKTNEDEEWGL